MINTMIDWKGSTMDIINVSKELFEDKSGNIVEMLKKNFSNEMLQKLYFFPKKISKELIIRKMNDNKYLNKISNTINYFKNLNIEKLILEKMQYFESDTNTKIENAKMFLIIGLDTTTIYSIKIDNEDVTVLLLEATNGDEDTLSMLLAHEFTHFIRKQKLNKDIFNDSIGERFVTEGIASNYSRQIVPNKKDSDYCIVNESTVEWVKSNTYIIEQNMKKQVDTDSLMSNYFYMFADTHITGMPVRTGYVYGYLKVREYLEKNKLKIKDILDIDWKKIINS